MRTFRFISCLAIILACLLGLNVQDGRAAVPGHTPMASISSADTELWSSRLSTDAAGNVWAVDTYNRTLRVFDAAGTELDSVSMNNPLAVGVDPVSGDVLVAEAGGTTVNIYTASDLTNPVGSLTGHTFYKVSSIAFASDGTVFVSDSTSGSIAKFDASTRALTGTLNSALDGGLTAPVQKPVALTIRAGQLYIGDRPFDGAAQLDKSRIIVADLAGTVISECNNFGSGQASNRFSKGSGQVYLPAGLGVDSSGLIYVADPVYDAIQVLNAACGHEGFIANAAEPMRTTNGLAMGPNGILYAGAINTHDIKVFTFDGAFTINPSSHDFGTLTPGGTPPVAVTVTLTNYSPQDAILTITNSTTWTTNTCGTGVTVPASSSVTCDIGVETLALTYSMQNETGKVTFTNQYGDSAEFAATVSTIDCLAGALISTPVSLNFEAQQFRLPPSSQSTLIEVCPGSPVDTPMTIVNAGSLPTWCSPSVDDVSDTLTVTVTDTSLSLGPQSPCTIEVAASGYANVFIPVNYLVIPFQSGTINVASNLDPAGAPYTLTLENNEQIKPGTTPAIHSPGDPTYEGNWTITWGNVAGNVTPPPETQYLCANCTINFAGNYGMPRVAVAKGPGIDNVSSIQLLDGAGSPVNSFTAFDSASVKYGARLAMGDIDGDLTDEILAAKGEGEANNTEVKCFEQDGTPITGCNFVAFSSAYLNGARVAAGDFDGDGVDEIIAATSMLRPLVRIISYTGGAAVSTGVYFNPFPGQTYGANIAAADMDGDGLDELVTTLAGKDAPQNSIKVWDVDSSGGLGLWTITEKAGWTTSQAMLASATAGGAAVAAVDDLIAVGSGSGNGIVELYDGSGTYICNITAIDTGDTTRQRTGIEVAVGDTDGDDLDEIIITLGSNPDSDTEVIIYNDDCTSNTTFTPVFPGAFFGARAAVGKVVN